MKHLFQLVLLSVVCAFFLTPVYSLASDYSGDFEGVDISTPDDNDGLDCDGGGGEFGGGCGGGGGGGDTGPTAEELAADADAAEKSAEAQDALDEARAYQDEIKEAEESIRAAENNLATSQSQIENAYQNSSDYYDVVNQVCQVATSNVSSAYGMVDKQSSVAGDVRGQYTADNLQSQGIVRNDPVFIASGVESFSRTDFSYQSLNDTIEIQRTYRSNLNNTDFSFGTGWVFNYDTRLIVGRKPFIKEREILTSRLNSEALQLQADANDKYNTSLAALDNANTHADQARQQANLIQQLNDQIAEFADLIEENRVVARAAADAAAQLALQGTAAAGASADSAQEYANQLQAVAQRAMAASAQSTTQAIVADQQATSAEQLALNCAEIVNHTLQQKIQVDHMAEILSEHATEAREEARLEEKLFPEDPYPADPSVYFGKGYVKVLEATGSPVVYREEGDGVFLPVSDNGSYTSRVYRTDTGYSLVTKNGYATGYAKTGTGTTVLSFMRDTNNNTTSFTRLGDTLTITDTVGRKTVATYNDDGHIVEVVDPDGNIYGYTYQNNLLASYTDPMGYVWYYEYDDNNRMISRTDPLEGTYRYVYDEMGRVIQEIDKAGFAIDYAYDPENKVTTEIDRRGNARMFHYNDANRTERIVFPDGTIQSFTYDEHNNITSKTDEIGVTTFITYNEFNDITTITDGLGGVTAFTYEPHFNKVATVTDALGRTRSFDYDHSGNITRITHPDGTTRSFTYNQFGLPISLIDENGHSTRFGYDQFGQLVEITHPDGTTKHQSPDILGRVTAVTDENGNTTSREYNALGKVIRTIDPLGAETLVGYDPLQRVIEKTDAKGNSYRFSYSKRGNLTQTVDPLGNVESRLYDAAENLIRITYPNETGVSYTLDDRDRIVTGRTFPGGRETVYVYDAKGQKIAIQDANGNITSNTFDDAGRVVSTTDAEGHTITSTFDPVGNLIRITDANGNPIDYAYDSLDRLIQETNAIGNTTAYTYDGLGNVIEKRKPDGTRISSIYDSRNHLIRTLYPDGSDKLYEYDNAGNMVRFANSETEELREYDPLGRLLTTSDTYNGQVSYGYDLLGNRTSITDPDNGVLTYRYDAKNRLASFTDPEGRTTTYQYDSMDRVIRTSLPNGVITEKEYNEDNWLASIETYSPRDGIISSFAYSYDSVGNKLAVLEEDGGETSYQYDRRYQLTRVSYPYREGSVPSYKNKGSKKGKGKKKGHMTEPSLAFEEFVYDPAGNRLSLMSNNESISYQYNGANQMLRAGDTTFSYDENGNRIRKDSEGETVVYSYTYDNFVSRVDDSGGASTIYGYDALNRRVYRTDRNGETVSYLYDGLEVFQEVSGRNAQKITAYYRANGNITTRQEYTVSQGNTAEYQHRPEGRQLFYTYDDLGSVAALTIHNSKLESRYRYSAFGRLLEGGFFDNVYGFTGKRFDMESNTYHFHFRQYDPVAGVWTTPDPIGVLGGVNVYGYVENDPVNFIDPLGLAKIVDGKIKPKIEGPFKSNLQKAIDAADQYVRNKALNKLGVPTPVAKGVLGNSLVDAEK